MDAKNPEACVGAFILNKQGEVLVLQSIKWKGNYTLPAGHIEYSETAEEAVKREVKEETSIEVENINFLTLEQRIQIGSGEFHRDGHFICLNFTCDAITESVRLNNESENYLWIDPTGLLNLKNVDSITRKSAEKFLEIYGSRTEEDVPLGIYEHYKGNRYNVLAIARHSETLGKIVVYKALYKHPEYGENAIFVRPLKMFKETVVIDNRAIPRFRKV